MNPRKKIEAIRTLIAGGDLDAALRECQQLLEKSPRHDEILHQTGRFAEVRRQIRWGTASYTDSTLTRNQIQAGLLELLTEVEKAAPESLKTVETDPAKRFLSPLRDLLHTRYQNRLSQKLSNRQPVNLRILPSTYGTSAETAALFTAYQGREVPQTLARCFADAHGRLLLTGAPGAGKTTLLLQLAQEQLEQPGPLPVLLNLASWRSAYKDLQEWLLHILPVELGVSQKLAQNLLQQNQLTLLFDGLDEVPEADRESCLRAIGEWGRDRNRQFVISSRREEYRRVAADAPVNQQIEVGPLSDDQIRAQLAAIGQTEPEAPRLLHALDNDAPLREAARTPFYLNALQFLFANRSTRLTDLNFTAPDTTGREAEVVERFVAEAFAPVRKAEKYTETEARHWLSFLASRMNTEGLVVFELEDLQDQYYIKSKYLNRLMFNFNYFLQDLSKFYILSIIILIIIGFSKLHELGIYIDFFSIAFIFISIFFIFFSLVISIFFSLLIEKIYEINYIKNDSYFASHKNKVKETFVISMLFYICLFFIKSFFTNNYNQELIVIFIFYNIYVLSERGKSDRYYNNLNKKPYYRLIKSINFLNFSILQHFHLRWLLYRRGLLPWRLVNFLNDMVACHLLESEGAQLDADGKVVKSGATWRFRHRILQDYFAARWREPE